MIYVCFFYIYTTLNFSVILMSIFILPFLACIISSHQNVSSSIGIFVHNLIAKDYLSENKQNEFLELMKIKIPIDASDSKWSLQIYPRTLAILAQVQYLYMLFIL